MAVAIKGADRGLRSVAEAELVEAENETLVVEIKVLVGSVISMIEIADLAMIAFVTIQGATKATMICRILETKRSIHGATHIARMSLGTAQTETHGVAMLTVTTTVEVPTSRMTEAGRLTIAATSRIMAAVVLVTCM